MVKQGREMIKIETYRKVQHAAKQVHEQLIHYIDADATEQSIAEVAKKLLHEQGIIETWYYDVPAFVLLGSRSCLSISGKNYQASTERVGETNLVTVDLSPMFDGAWGDCARSFFIEGGESTIYPKSTEFRQGQETEQMLHDQMCQFVTPETRFSELYEFGNHQIQKLGYENLDFLSNLGHSIETQSSQRRFIDANCLETLGSVNFFTFEPHIREVDGKWGFKHENIYYFDESGCLVEL